MPSTKQKKLKIVFFGTGPISVATAKQLHKYFDIEAVITKTDRSKPNGKLQPTLLADWAEQKNLTLCKVENKAALDALLESSKFESRVGVVVDFGIIISKQVIDSFAKGILNSHFSLLPKYRGADPITAAILNGDKQTGVSIMLIEPTLDTGNLLGQETSQIDPNMEIQELEDALTMLGAKMLIELIPPYLEDILELVPQKAEGITHTKMLTKQDGLLDPTKTAEQLSNQVRAFLVWPKSYLEQDGQRFVITKAIPSTKRSTTGRLTIIDNALFFGCKDGSLEVLEIQPAGKTKMNAAAFINGYTEKL